MRRRFIGAAMAAMFAVIFTLFLGINVWNYGNITSQQDRTLQRLLTEELKAPPLDKLGPFSPEVSYMMRFFSVRYDNGNEVKINSDYIATVSKSEAKTLADKVIAEKKERGYIGGYRFLSESSKGGRTVIFLNSEKELQGARSLLFITAAIAVLCLATTFVLVLLFSKRAIAPYVKNLETQKKFITNASHELKTPLTAIATSAEVLYAEEPSEWVNNIKLQTAKMSKLVTDLTTLSRLDEERPFSNETPFSLSDAVWEICEPFKTLAKAKQKSFTSEIEDGLQLTKDRAAVCQILSVFLDNAIKYSPENGEISLKVAKNGRKTEISVTNDCLPEDDIDTEKLFDRFYRGKSSRKKPEGTGIGLSIAKSAADATGGKIFAVKQDREITFKIVY